MSFKTFSLILVLAFSLGAHAKDCLLSEALKDPQLSANEEFWREYGALSPKEQASDSHLKALVSKYRSADRTVGPSATPNAVRVLNLAIQNKAEKEIKVLPPNLKQKVDEFLSVALKAGGIKEIRDNPGRWHLEKLPQFGESAYSVRLNDGYRVLFDAGPDAIEVRRVNKGQIHGN